MRWIFRLFKKQDNRPPHERWPEVLHWEFNDQFQTFDKANLIALTEDGCIIMSGWDHHKHKYRIQDLLGHNLSLKDRRLDREIQSTAEYNDLLQEFHRAFAELKARDKRNGIAA